MMMMMMKKKRMMEDNLQLGDAGGFAAVEMDLRLPEVVIEMLSVPHPKWCCVGPKWPDMPLNDLTNVWRAAPVNLSFVTLSSHLSLPSQACIMFERLRVVTHSLHTVQQQIPFEADSWGRLTSNRVMPENVAQFVTQGNACCPSNKGRKVWLQPFVRPLCGEYGMYGIGGSSRERNKEVMWDSILGSFWFWTNSRIELKTIKRL